MRIHERRFDPHSSPHGSRRARARTAAAAPRALNTPPPNSCSTRPLRESGADQSIRRGRITMQQQLIIFDTTMRDGEQSPGAAMSKDDKVRIGRQLEKLRVDGIEAAFATPSPADVEAICAPADAPNDSTLCSLARAHHHSL